MKLILEPGAYGSALLRVSTNSEKQPSLPHQLSMARKAAAAHGVEIPDDAVYTDQMSRSLWPRPGVAAALLRSQDPRCVMVVVWEGSRLWGDARQQLDIFEALQATGTVLLNANGDHLNDPNEVVEFTQGIDSLLSRLEVRRLSRRVHETHVERFEKGVFIQKPPYGFRYDSDRQAVVPVQEQLENLRMAWRWLAEEGITLYGVATRWRRMGIKTKGNYQRKGVTVLPADWSQSNLHRTLTNRLYVGEMTWNRRRTVRLGGRKKMIKRPESEWKRAPSPWGNVVARPHDCTENDCPTCSAALELFERACTTIRVRAGQHSSTPRPDTVRLFGNIVRCGTCGRRMYPRKDAGTKDRPIRRSFTFYCKLNNGCPKPPTISENTLLRMFSQLTGATTPTTFPRWTVKATLQSDDDYVTTDSTQERIDKLQAERGNYLRLRAQEIISSDAQLREYLDEVDTRLAAARQELVELEARPDVERETRTDSVLKLLKDLVPTLTDDSIPIEKRQALLQRYVARIVVNKPLIVFEFLGVGEDR